MEVACKSFRITIDKSLGWTKELIGIKVGEDSLSCSIFDI